METDSEQDSRAPEGEKDIKLEDEERTKNLGASTAPPASPADAMSFGQRWWNISLLSVGWCMAVSSFFLQVSNTPSIVLALTGNRGTSTLSFGVMLLTSAISAIPGSLMMGVVGRRWVYLTGGVAAIAGAIIQIFGMRAKSTTLLIIGILPQGYMYALANSLRFAAQDFTLPAERPRALSMLVAGAILSALVGPESSRRARNMIHGSEYTGIYVVVLIIYVVQLLAIGVLAQWGRVRLPPPPAWGGWRASPREIVRSIWEMVNHKSFTLPMLAAAWAYAWMAALTSATPVVMASHGYSLNVRITAIEVHLLCMFGPAFINGSLAKRIGAIRVLLIGFLVKAAATGVYFATGGLWVYFLGLALMGAGWSFSYVAASVLGTQGFMSKIKDPREKILSQVTAEVGTNPSARPATASPHRPRLRDST